MTTQNNTPAFVEGYTLIEKIGSGSFSNVYKARKSQSSEVVAIKCVKVANLSKSSVDNLLCEIKLLKELKHRHIVKLYDFRWDQNYVYLIMEYCSGGDLSCFIKTHHRLSESTCQFFLQQLALALKYLRQKNISHFDLKPQNILIYSKNLQQLKLADFGLAQYMTEDDTISTVKGSPLYMAPEIVRHKKFDIKADLWSVGVILYECLFGKAPYSSTSIDELILKIKDESKIRLPFNAKISSECKDFLFKCLQKNVDDRIDYLTFFAHPFVGLKYVPNENSMTQVTASLEIAINEDRNGRLDEAFLLYNEAVKYLVPMMHLETNFSKKVEIKQKLMQYVKRMEEIKSSRRPTSSNTTISSIHDSLGLDFRFNNNLKELVQLSKTTPSIETAIEIAQSAELYSVEKKYEIALDKYEMALGMLLSLSSAEPKGRRKDLLLDELNRWMEQAETIKLLLKNSNDYDAKVLPEAESIKTCCLQ